MCFSKPVEVTGNSKKRQLMVRLHVCLQKPKFLIELVRASEYIFMNHTSLMRHQTYLKVIHYYGFFFIFRKLQFRNVF